MKAIASASASSARTASGLAPRLRASCSSSPRAGAAHPDQLGDWCAAWVERIAVLYRAHHALAATIPGTGAHEQARQRYQRAFADLDAARILQTQSAARGLLHPAAAKVIATLNNEWDGLVRHQDLPQLPLDNNTAERALRNPVIGRKNFYGSGARWAGPVNLKWPHFVL